MAWAMVAAVRPGVRADIRSPRGRWDLWPCSSPWGRRSCLPGGSYLFVWPLAAAGAAWCLRVALPSLDRADPSAIAAHLIAAMIAVALFVSAGWQLGVVFGPAAAPALAGIGAFAASAAVHSMKSFGDARRWAAPSLLIGSALALIAVTHVVPPFDARAPRPDSLLYALDADRGAASWVSFDSTPDAWTRGALNGAESAPLSELFSRWKGAGLRATAPVVALDPPLVGVLEDTRAGWTRSLRLRLLFSPSVEAVEHSRCRRRRT